MEWFNALNPLTQQLLIGLATEYAGLAASMLYDAARTRLEAHSAAQRQQEAVRAAIQRALSDALLQTLPLLTDAPEQMQHALGLLGQWLARPAVAGQYARLIAPVLKADLDRTLLGAEFEKAGFDPASLTQPFGSIADSIGAAFVASAAWQGELQPVIAIGELRRGNALLERLAPLDLDDLERHYLNQVYAECNALPLADVEKGQRQPRLQRVFVDVRVRDAVPADEEVMARLGFFGDSSAHVGRVVKRVLGERSGRKTEAEGNAGWTQAMRQLDKAALAQVAEALGVEADELSRALENLTPLEVLARQAAPRLVLLGDPGSGKSTLTRRWAGVLAALGQPEHRQDWVEDEERAADELLRVFDRWLLPVRVLLSQWAQQLPDFRPNATDNACAADLLNECWRIYNRTANLGSDAARQRFVAKFVGNAPSVLLLLDGLDEVTDPNRRQAVRHALEDFAGTYPAVPLVVTSRVRPYEALRREKKALSWPTATLDRLTQGAIGHFVDRWHAELVAMHAWEGDQATTRRHHFTEALATPDRAELREMAGTPLLLTMMVKVNYKERLPDSRAELYEVFVKQLLFEWERRRQGEEKEQSGLDQLLAEARIPEDQFVYHLNALAYAIHDGANRDTVDISADRLKRMLMNLHIGLKVDDDPDQYEDDDAVAAALKWARKVMRFIADRSGLINWEDHNVYRFSHRSYQEYLAARWMATGRDFRDKFDSRIDDEDWRETVLLAIGYQCKVRGAPYDDTLDILYEFWPEELGTLAATSRVLLLGEAFIYQLELKRLGRDKKARNLHADVCRDLTALMQQPALTAYLTDPKAQARTRFAAGSLLSALGDPRPGVGVGADGLPDILWLPVEVGDFPMGSDAASDEQPIHPVYLDAFEIAKYPVTNSQYACFVAATDRKPPKHWGGRMPPDELRTHPVVAVSWEDAAAFCGWLSERCGARIHLPTEAEWEKAARGTDGRTYPWEGVFDAARCNMRDTGIGGTSPVGMFPAGESPYEVADMAGNVWEWVNDWYDKDYYRRSPRANPQGPERGTYRVLRGGSWGSNVGSVRSAFRVNDFPVDWLNFGLGFRCVRSL